jgi:ferrous iron transport protein B
MSRQEIQIAFVGNPNCGKTTLFNAYTGAKLKVANWPGVTVEMKEGSYIYQNNRLKLVDLPGVYSLTSYTMEEKLTREYLTDSKVDIIVNVVDASNLERNLYLTLQLAELGKPMVLALNMMDIVKERGMEIDLSKLSALLKIPVIAVSARKKTGLEQLINAVVELHKNPSFIKERKQATFEKVNTKPGQSGSSLRNEEEINIKYDIIEKMLEKVMVRKQQRAESSDKVDRILTHRFFGLPIFLIIMGLVFFFTFKVGDFIKIGFEVIIDWISTGTQNLLITLQASDVVTSLVVDGIIAGVGGIITFLPNIFILFLALAYLEDSGYMARVAYVMDGIMSKLGLSGKAFIPMLLGFGCTVPAIMASRSLENMQDRRKTILITPFMSCSARLPIYILFSQMFFQPYAMWAAYSMYLLGIIVAIAVAFFMKSSTDKSLMNALLIELPEYKAPNWQTIGITVWEKVKEYITRAGTTIFVASVVIWVILNFGPSGMVTDMSMSFGATLGKVLAPLLAPAGLGLWQVVLALISGIAAKEVVVSSFSVLFHINNINSAQGMESLSRLLGNSDFGPLNAYALMAFCLLYIPCAATIGVIQREMRSAKWTVFTIFFQLGIAWLVATLIFQIGSHL